MQARHIATQVRPPCMRCSTHLSSCGLSAQSRRDGSATGRDSGHPDTLRAVMFRLLMSGSTGSSSISASSASSSISCSSHKLTDRLAGSCSA